MGITSDLQTPDETDLCLRCHNKKGCPLRSPCCDTTSKCVLFVPENGMIIELIE